MKKVILFVSVLCFISCNRTKDGMHIDDYLGDYKLQNQISISDIDFSGTSSLENNYFYDDETNRIFLLTFDNGLHLSYHDLNDINSSREIKLIKGKGPGEYMHKMSLCGIQDDAVVLYDPGLKRINYYDFSLNFIDTEYVNESVDILYVFIHNNTLYFLCSNGEKIIDIYRSIEGKMELCNHTNLKNTFEIQHFKDTYLFLINISDDMIILKRGNSVIKVDVDTGDTEEIAYRDKEDVIDVVCCVTDRYIIYKYGEGIEVPFNIYDIETGKTRKNFIDNVFLLQMNDAVITGNNNDYKLYKK